MQLKRDPLVKIRKIWALWRVQLARVRDIKRTQRAIGSLTRWLPILFDRQRARAAVCSHRARLENQRALASSLMQRALVRSRCERWASALRAGRPLLLRPHGPRLADSGAGSQPAARWRRALGSREETRNALIQSRGREVLATCRIVTTH